MLMRFTQNDHYGNRNLLVSSLTKSLESPIFIRIIIAGIFTVSYINRIFRSMRWRTNDGYPINVLKYNYNKGI
jgi:hypothetical protein